MSKVFVLDAQKQPLNPMHPGRARVLLKQGQAAVYRRQRKTGYRKHVSPIATQVVSLHIKATGHSNRQMCRMDRCGFPRTGPKQHKRVKGFQTGDLVRAVVPSGRKRGRYGGKVAVRASGSFKITTHGTVEGISYRYCTLIARSDGYSYTQGKERALPPVGLQAARGSARIEL